MFEDYTKRCRVRAVKLGQPYAYSLSDPIVINCPTVYRPGDRAVLSDVEAGARSVVELCLAEEIASVAVPALGCGCGKLAWSDVRSSLEKALDRPDLVVYLYEPMEKRWT